MSSLVDHHGRPLARATAQELTIAEYTAQVRAESGGSVSAPARQVGWYYSCLTQTVRAVSQMPLKLWLESFGARGVRPGFRQVFNHPRVHPRLRRPTPTLSMIRWLEQWGSRLLDGGNVWSIPDTRPSPDGVWRSLPLYGRSQVQPVRDGWNGPLVAWEVQRSPSGKVETLDLDQVMHWALPNPYDDVLGLAPKDAIRMRLDAAFAQAIYERSFYQRSATPSGVLINKNHELDGSQRSEIRESFEEFHGGPDKAGRLLILGNEWDFKQWALQQSQSQFIESGKFGREEIAAAFFGFPVGMLNAQENGGLSKAGEEADRLKLFENCAFPLARLFEPEFNHGFVSRVAPGHEVAFDTRQVPVALVYAKAESEIFKTYVGNGIATNAVIEAFDLPFDPQVGGDVPLVMKSLVPLESVGEMADGDAGDDEDETVPSPPAKVKQKALSEPERSADPLTPLVSRLRVKVKQALYGIRALALRDPVRAAAGASAADRRRWARHFLPPIAVAVEAGADPEAMDVSPAVVQRALKELQGHADVIRFAVPAREAICEAAVSKLLTLLDETQRDAAACGTPDAYLGSLDRAAAVIAERTIQNAVAAGAATAMEAAA